MSHKIDTTETDEMFETCGYHKFHSIVDECNAYVASYQKCIRDNNGKKYYINIHAFENIVKSKTPSQFMFSTDCQFNSAMGTFEVKYHVGQDVSTKDVETFYEDMWRRMACKYYDEV